jgi:hypothetical protein
MIWATPDTEDDIRDVMSSTGLTRKTLLQAMSNERKRYRGEGYSDDDLKELRASNNLVLKLDDASEALRACIQAGSLPPGAYVRLKCMIDLAVYMMTFRMRHTADSNYRLRRRSCNPVCESTFLYRPKVLFGLINIENVGTDYFFVVSDR